MFATRNDGDPPAAPPGLCDGPRLPEIGGVRVGLMFNLPKDTPMTPAGAAALFGGPVAACIFGGTHEASVAEADGVLFVNPGSPSLAKTPHTGGGPHDRRWPRVGADRGRGLGVSPEHGPAW